MNIIDIIKLEVDFHNLHTCELTLEIENEDLSDSNVYPFPLTSFPGFISDIKHLVDKHFTHRVKEMHLTRIPIKD